MTALAGFISANGAAVGACLADSPGTVLLLLDGEGRVLDCSPGFLLITGLEEKPLGRRLGELAAGGRLPQLPGDGACARLRLNLRDGLGETQGLDCLALGRGGAVLLVGERSRLLQSAAVSSMSGINDELVNVARELQKKKAALENALARVRTLEGMLPICASCKKIRDDKGEWQPVEHYIKQRTDTTFSHGICPDCSKRLYPGLSD